MDFIVRAAVELDVSRLRSGVSEAERIVAGLEQRARQVARGSSASDLGSFGSEAGGTRAALVKAADTPGIGEDLRRSYLGLIRRLDEAGTKLAQDFQGYGSKDRVERAGNVLGTRMDQAAGAVDTLRRRYEREANRPAARGATREVPVLENSGALFEQKVRRDAAAAEAFARFNRPQTDEDRAGVDARSNRLYEQEQFKAQDRIRIQTARTQIEEELLGDTQKLAEARKREVAAARAAAGVNQAITGAPDVVDARAALRVQQERTRRAHALDYEQKLTPEDKVQAGGLDFIRGQRAQQEAIVSERLKAADDDYIRQTAELANLRRTRKAQEQQATLLSTPASTIEREAENQLLREQERAQAQVARAALLATPSGTTFVAEKGEAAAAQRAETEAIRRATAERLAGDQTYITNKAAAARAEAQLNAAVTRQVRQLNLQGNNGSPISDGGSTFQRVQALIKSRQSGDVVDPTSLMGLGQFITSRAITTAGFAASGALLYGGVQGIREMVKAAEDLQLASSHVRAEFEALGQGNQFSGFRDQLLGIARDTGVAGSEILQVGLLMKGAFGDTQTAVDQTREAAQGMAILGLSGSEAVNTFVSLSKTFGVSISDITDKALGLQDRWGVMAKEIIQGAASIAPIAKQVGLGFTELTALIAAAAQATGRPVASVAEGFGRILPQLQKQAAPLLSLYASTPALAPNIDKITEAFKSGNEGQVLIQLVRDWNKLTEAQQTGTLSLLGGRREAQVLADALQNPDRVLQELDGHMNDAGRTTKSWAEYQATLSASLKRMGEDLRQIGDVLARSGLLDGFAVIAGGGELLLKTIRALLTVFERANDLTHGWAGRLAALAIAIKAVQAAMEAMAAARTTIGLIQGAIGGGAAAAAAPAAGASLQGELFPVAATTAVVKPGLLGRVGGAINQPSVGSSGIGTAEGIGGSGWLAAGSGSLYLATAALAFASYELVNHDIKGWQKDSKDIKAARQSAKDNLKDKDLLSLEAVQKDGDWSENVQAVGGETQAQTLRRRIDEETLKNFQEAVAKGYIKLAKGQADAWIKGMKKGGTSGKNYANAARDALSGLSKKQQYDVQGAVNAAQAPADDIQHTIDTSGDALVADSETLMQMFSSGTISYTTLITKLRDQVARAQAADNGSEPELHKNALQLQAQLQAQVTARLNGLIQFAQGQAQLAGVDPSKAALQSFDAVGLGNTPIAPGDPNDPTVQFGQGLINSSIQRNLTGLRESGGQNELNFATQAANAQRQAFLERLKQMPSAAAALEAGKTGEQLDPATRTALIEAYKAVYGVDIDPKDIGLTRDEILGFQNTALQQAITQIQVAYAGIRDPALQAKAAAAIADAEKKAADAMAEGPEKAAAEAKAAIDAANATNQGQDVATAARDANANLRIAQANRDPVAIARINRERAIANRDEAVKQGKGQAAIDQANADIATADQQAADAQVDISSAKRDYLKALAADSPLAQARLDQQQANAEVANAHGDAEKLRAQAHQVQADHSFRDAVLALDIAKIDYLKAQHAAAGDQAAAAQDQVQEDQRRIAEFVSQHPNAAREGDDFHAGWLTLQTQLITDQAGAVDAQIQQTERQLDTDRQLGRISIQQEVQRLKLLEKTAKSQQQVDDLELKIQDLLKQAEGDAAWNLPSSLKMPTLYEIRRTDQLGGLNHYQDSRQVTFGAGSIVIQKDMSPQEITGIVSNAVLSGGVVYGTTPRGY